MLMQDWPMQDGTIRGPMCLPERDSGLGLLYIYIILI